MTSASPILAVDRLWAGYGETMVIRGLSLTVNVGQTAVVIGPNGHGKTTLLRAISGLLKPARGRILLDGTPVQGRPAEHLAALGMVHVPQGDGLFPEMTVEENLLLGAFPPAAWRNRREGLESVYARFPAVQARSSQRARTLSGGERRLVALGRSLMRAPRVLLIDEPSLGLAPVMIDALYEAIDGLKRAGTTILLVEENFTHIGRVADVVYVVESGAVVRAGSYAELSADQTIVETYLGAV